MLGFARGVGLELGDPALGDVLDDADDHPAVVGVDDVAVRVHPAQRTVVTAADAVLVLERLAVVQGLLEGTAQRRGVVVVDEPVKALDLARRPGLVAEQLQQVVVAVGLAPRRVVDVGAEVGGTQGEVGAHVVRRQAATLLHAPSSLVTPGHDTACVPNPSRPEAGAANLRAGFTRAD